MADFSSSQMLPVGTMLDGRYRIEKYLASGGFGNTYMAFDTRFNSNVAVKEFFMRGTNHRAEDHSTVLVSNAANQEGFDQQLNKFRREAQRIFNMRNDHIVHVIDLFDANGTSYYVMDFIEGESLKDRVKRQSMTETEVRDVADQLLDALDAVHKAGFYHLDVKPGNIMTDKKGHCTLIDFGASKQMSAMERTSLSASGMAYTPGYAPIEQEGQRTKSIGPWTDFYAVGATLYSLLTGERPPEVEPDDTDDDSRMFDYPDGVSTEMRKAISKMMNPLPRKRPQNVEDMKELLKANDNRDNDASNDATIVQTTKKPSSPVGAVPPCPPERAEASQETQILQKERSDNRVDKHEDAAPTPDNEPPSPSKKKLWIALAAVACLAGILFFILKPGGKSADSTTVVQDDNLTAQFDGQTFTVDGISFNMMPVEGGTFTMGATSEQGNDAGDDENPAHLVTLSDYSIGETEVTQALWKAVMGSNPSNFKGEDLPVETVSWDDCQSFIRKLNAATEGQRPEGREFRLPTEAEWEFAARGGNKSNHTKYAGGNSMISVGWYYENSGDQMLDDSNWSFDKLSENNCKTHPVAKKSPNELGLYDMSGNVYEWCQDWYDDNYYGKSPQNNPCNNTQASFRVSRGGSWYDDAGLCRVSLRYCGTPVSTFDGLGLRLAL
ncbi:MAG: SUMF1/EgtB/PvdO family nonheme iron enzyme [Prevotella sp.]|nr:SUMF1/EgtB/PvdO family nonheme iron enzyme [Prevotella sp.]